MFFRFLQMFSSCYRRPKLRRHIVHTQICRGNMIIHTLTSVKSLLLVIFEHFNSNKAVVWNDLTLVLRAAQVLFFYISNIPTFESVIKSC